ncbi:uncharacterized protein LOC106165424 [Lingula anatina]|uniref:Uncharacterized protein LOC106165424 n=1 Tax=Lingula anatina TaxID=7574 RepID=A0A1S3IMF7_LINAN|nr:uncharacterized protein LOC106165424 [Lingula anatina]|eukprot:XP_013399081.1 uncharacterized protein LOC106165424 [Lingula anatina]
MLDYYPGGVDVINNAYTATWTIQGVLVCVKPAGQDRPVTKGSVRTNVYVAHNGQTAVVNVHPDGQGLIAIPQVPCVRRTAVHMEPWTCQAARVAVSLVGQERSALNVS